MHKSCEQVMTRNVKACRESDTVADAAKLMRDHNIGVLPVLGTSGKLTGVVTDRDLALRVLADRKSSDISVGAVMSHGELLTVKPGDPVEHAEKLMMDHATQRVIVAENDRPVGIISRTEIAGAEDDRRAGEVFSAVVQGGVADKPESGAGIRPAQHRGEAEASHAKERSEFAHRGEKVSPPKEMTKSEEHPANGRPPAQLKNPRQAGANGPGMEHRENRQRGA